MITIVRPKKLHELKCLEKFYGAADDSIVSDSWVTMPITWKLFHDPINVIWLDFKYKCSY